MPLGLPGGLNRSPDAFYAFAIDAAVDESTKEVWMLSLTPSETTIFFILKMPSHSVLQLLMKTFQKCGAIKTSLHLEHHLSSFHQVQQQILVHMMK